MDVETGFKAQMDHLWPTISKFQKGGGETSMSAFSSIDGAPNGSVGVRKVTMREERSIKVRQAFSSKHPVTVKIVKSTRRRGARTD